MCQIEEAQMLVYPLAAEGCGSNFDDPSCPSITFIKVDRLLQLNSLNLPLPFQHEDQASD